MKIAGTENVDQPHGTFRNRDFRITAFTLVTIGRLLSGAERQQ